MRPPTPLLCHDAVCVQARHGLRESYQAAGLEEDADSVAYWEQLAQEHVLVSGVAGSACMASWVR